MKFSANRAGQHQPSEDGDLDGPQDLDEFARMTTRIDELLGQVIELRCQLQQLERGDGKLSGALVGLFTHHMVVPEPRLLNPYEEIAPGVRVGFQSGARVTAAVDRKVDFSRSPDYCLNTVTLQFDGKSDWFTIEFPVSWGEVQEASAFQLDLYSEQDRAIESRAVLRAISRDAEHKDHELASFNLLPGPENRNVSKQGDIALPSHFNGVDSTELRALLFFDTTGHLTIRLNYLSLYFA
jgi:hypothetical protein